MNINKLSSKIASSKIYRGILPKTTDGVRLQNFFSSKIMVQDYRRSKTTGVFVQQAFDCRLSFFNNKI